MHEGEVVRKFVEPARTYYTIMPVYVGQICYSGYKGTQSCHPNYIYVPYQMYDDEDYVIVLEKCEGSDCQRGQRVLNPAEWERVVAGDWWSDKDKKRFVLEDEDKRVRRVSRDKLPEGTGT